MGLFNERTGDDRAVLQHVLEVHEVAVVHVLGDVYKRQLQILSSFGGIFSINIRHGILLSLKNIEAAETVQTTIRIFCLLYTSSLLV